ncbi:MAG: beta-galactosidase, partial [Paracoccaceae bacterium]
ILREHAPGRPVTHNFMANSFDFDHYAVAADLDFACWDSYPLGALWHGNLGEDEKLERLRTGSPDYQAFYCDLYRHAGGGKAWITEQQPGPVNWADHNPAPAAGMVRLWTWQAYAHGVDTVCFFRWRQAASGQEQYHSGLLLPDGTPGAAYHEVAQVARERRRLPEAGRREPAPVALVLDYPSRWALEILPQGMDVPGRAALWDWYCALAQLGVDADIVAPGADLSGYRLVCVPSLAVCTEEFAARLRAADARVLLGPRSGSKTGDMHIPGILPPGPLSALIDLRVTGVESLPPGHAEQVIWQGCQYAVGGWRESMTTSEPVVATFAAPHGAGSPAIAGNDRCRYLACLPQGEFLTGFMADCLAWAGIAAAPTGPDLRITRRGVLSFAFNFGAGPVELPAGKDAALLIGGRQIPPAGLAVWRAVAEPGG